MTESTICVWQRWQIFSFLTSLITRTLRVMERIAVISTFDQPLLINADVMKSNLSVLGDVFVSAGTWKVPWFIPLIVNTNITNSSRKQNHSKIGFCKALDVLCRKSGCKIFTFVFPLVQTFSTLNDLVFDNICTAF